MLSGTYLTILTLVISPRAALVCRTAAEVFATCKLLFCPSPKAATPPVEDLTAPAVVRGMAVG